METTCSAHSDLKGRLFRQAAFFLGLSGSATSSLLGLKAMSDWESRSDEAQSLGCFVLVLLGVLLFFAGIGVGYWFLK